MVRSKHPELHNDELQWFLESADSACGLQSSSTDMEEAWEVIRATAASAEAQEEYRQYSLRDRIRASFMLELGRHASANEVETKAYYAEQLGVGVVQASGFEVDDAILDGTDLYDRGQCDYHEQTLFAKLRRCTQRWRALSEASKRTLAAWYLGMNPAWPADMREAARRSFGDFAAVACWSMSDEELLLTSLDPLEKRIRLELDVRRAHREWAAAA